MKMLKVLIIAYNNMGKGGIQNQIMGVVRNLRGKANFDVVVWDDAKNHYVPELQSYGVRIVRCYRRIGNNTLRRKADAFVRYGDIRRIVEKVIQENGPYDVIHCNNAFDAAPCLEAAYKFGIPVRISHAHGTENPNLKKKKVYLLYRLLYAHNRKKMQYYATHMIACSRQAADYHFGNGNGKVIPIGINLREFQKNTVPEKSTGTIQILHVGGMNEKKNQLFLLDIMEELLKRNANVHLTMVGDGGAYLSLVKGRIREKGLERYISLLPANTNIPGVMASADIFLLPSISEGFGIVLIEAQAVGLRCIAADCVPHETNCGGVQYLSLDQGAAHWAEQILEGVASVPTQRQAYDVSAFSDENMSDCVYEIYLDTIEG